MLKTTIMNIAIVIGTALLPVSDPVKMIVFPLNSPSNTGSFSWLSEGIAVSISRQLRGHGVEVMDRKERVKLVENLDLPPNARLSEASMIRVAQQAKADLIVMGTISGTDRNFKVSVRVLDIKALKLGGEMIANGPLSAMPQMENELAWLILTNTALGNADTRKDFQDRMRRIPNLAYADFIRSLGSTSQNEQTQLLTKAVAAYRDFPEAQFELSRIYFQQGHCDKTLQHLAFADGGGISQPEKEFMEGTCCLMEEQLLQSIQTFSRSLPYARSFEVLNNMGVAYLRSGDIALALNVLLEAKNLSKTDATVALNLAIARHLQGNDTAARAVVEDAIKSYPKNGTLQFLLGFLLKALGEEEKAATAISKAKSLGVNIDKKEAENPLAWTRAITTWHR